MQVWPLAGVAPLPGLLSSYERPLGVVVIAMAATLEPRRGASEAQIRRASCRRRRKLAAANPKPASKSAAPPAGERPTTSHAQPGAFSERKLPELLLPVAFEVAPSDRPPTVMPPSEPPLL